MAVYAIGEAEYEIPDNVQGDQLTQVLTQLASQHKPDTQPKGSAQIRNDMPDSVQAEQTPAAQAPEYSLAGDAKRSLGLTARTALTGLGAPVTGALDVLGYPVKKGIEYATGQPQQSVTETFLQGVDATGLPKPESTLERYTDVAGRGAIGAAGGLSVGGLLGGAQSATTQGVGGILSAAPAAQTTAGITSGISSELAKDAGAGPVGQMLAGLTGGVGGGLLARGIDAPATQIPLLAGAATTADDAQGIRNVTRQMEEAATQSVDEMQPVVRVAVTGASDIGLDFNALDEGLRARILQQANRAMNTQSDLTPAAIARSALYESEGFTPTRALATRNFEDNLNEQNIMSEPEGGQLRNVYMSNNQNIRNRIRDLAPEGVEPVDQPTFGQEFRQPIVQGERSAQRITNRAYTAADAAEGGNQAPTAELNSVIERNAGVFENRPSTAGLMDDLRNTGLLRREVRNAEMIGETEPFTLRDLARARAAVNEAWTTARNTGDARAAGRLSEVRTAMDALEEQAGGELYNAYRNLRGQKGRLYENNPLIDKLISDQKGYIGTDLIEDSKVFDRAVVASSPEQFSRVWPRLTTRAQNLTRSQVSQFIEDRVFSNQGTNEAGDVVASAAKLNQALNDIGPQKLRMIYGPERSDRLNTLNRAVREISNPPKGTVPTGSAPKLSYLYRQSMNILGLAGKIPGLNVVVDVAERRAADAATRQGANQALNLIQEAPTRSQPLLDRIMNRVEPVSPLLYPSLQGQ